MCSDALSGKSPQQCELQTIILLQSLILASTSIIVPSDNQLSTEFTPLQNIRLLMDLFVTGKIPSGASRPLNEEKIHLTTTCLGLPMPSVEIAMRVVRLQGILPIRCQALAVCIMRVPEAIG